MTRALDLFAGPGGWDVAADRLGLETDGIEWDAAANLTRAAAGHKTIWEDVGTYDAYDAFGHYEGLIASPPCQSFSAAGKRKGLEDPRGQLVFEVMRYTWQMWPTWVVCEQVPAVLPIWEEFAKQLRSMGYSTWTGLLHAEQYGVPQTRKRAILIASRDRNVGPPKPSHSRYYSRTPERLDEGVQKWVSMAEALSWGAPWRPSPTITGGGTEAGGAEPIAHLKRYTSDPRWIVAAGVTGEGRPRSDDRPAPTITGKGTAYWLPKERVTVQEAGILQSFPADYPWQGKKGEQYQQVGNAIPPLLAEAVLRQVL